MKCGHGDCAVKIKELLRGEGKVTVYIDMIFMHARACDVQPANQALNTMRLVIAMTFYHVLMWHLNNGPSIWDTGLCVEVFFIQRD